MTSSRYRFDWDPEIAKANLAKHGVSFEEAATVFGDALGWIYLDPLHSSQEGREIIVGESVAGRLLLVCFTEQERIVRILSAREPTKFERRKYEEESFRIE